MKILLDIQNSPAPRQMPQVPSCFDDIIFTIGNYLKIDCFPMFAASYSFDFRKTAKSASEKYYERIAVHDRKIELLEKFCGLTYYYIKISPNDNLTDIIIDELQNGNMMAVHFDAYYCPWDQFYGQFHNDHMVIVSGIDTEKSEIYVCDPWFDTARKIDSDILKNACKYAVIFVQTENPTVKPSKHSAAEYLRSSVFTDGVSAFDSMREFAEEFRCGFDSGDIECDNFFYSDYHGILQKVIYSRCKYLSFLKYASDSFGFVPFDNPDKLKHFALSWRNIQWMIGKAYIQKADRNNILTDRIYRKIILLADEEESCFNGFLIADSEKSGLLSRLDDENNSKVRCEANAFQKYAVDLSKYYNNKALDYTSDYKGADFGGLGEFFCLDNAVGEKNSLYGEYDLYLPYKADCKYDNMICLGQKIKLPSLCVRRVVFRGFSEYGSYSDYFGITDSDGKDSFYLLSFSDYSTPPSDSETVLLTTDVCASDGDKFVTAHKDCHIFAKSIELNGKRGGLLTLPYCPCIHIFSILFF